MAKYGAAEAVEMLEESGVLDRLKEDAQTAREEERATHLQRLGEVEKRLLELSEADAKQTSGQAAEVARLEALLAEAKAGLRQRNEELAGLDATANKLRGKLRRLADPRIEAAILKLSDYAEIARQRFRTGEEPIRGLFVRKVTKTVSNADQVAEVMALARAGRAQLEVLKEAERPANLEAVIAEIVDPVKARLRELAGLH